MKTETIDSRSSTIVLLKALAGCSNRTDQIVALVELFRREFGRAAAVECAERLAVLQPHEVRMRRMCRSAAEYLNGRYAERSPRRAVERAVSGTEFWDIAAHPPETDTDTDNERDTRDREMPRVRIGDVLVNRVAPAGETPSYAVVVSVDHDAGVFRYVYESHASDTELSVAAYQAEIDRVAPRVGVSTADHKFEHEMFPGRE